MVQTPRGEGRAMNSLSPYDVRITYAGQPAQANNNFSYTGSDWFGPLPPMQPVAPPEVAGRVLDFIPGYNLTTQPRYEEPVTFPTLRALAESYDPLRLIIERRKDQMARMPWVIRAKHEDSGGTKRPKISELPAAQQSRIKEVQAFFKKPDRQISFRGWLRMLLEDLFVLDAPSIYCERTRGGDLLELRIVDGSMIKRVIDDWGRSPYPIAWTGTPFMWNGVVISSESYERLGFKLFNGLMYPPAYQQIMKGLPAVNLSTFELLYRPNNWRPGKVYGNSPVEQVLMTVSIALRRSTSQLEYYREGNMPEGIFGLPESYTTDQTQRFQDYWDNLFVGNLGKRRTMKFMPASSKSAYVPLKEPPLKNEFDEWLTRICCFAFSYPPNAFVHMLNRASGEQHEKQAEEEGLQPTKQWVAELLNEVIETELGGDEIEFAWVEEDEIDQEKQAAILTTLSDSGLLTKNQGRERLGEEPDTNPAADILMAKTATGYVPIDANMIEQKVAAAKAMQEVMPEPVAPVGSPKIKAPSLKENA